MTAWRIVVQKIYEHGPQTAHQLELAGATRKGVDEARAKGLVAHPTGRAGGPPQRPYHLTGRGVAYSQGTLDFRVVTTPPAGGARGRWAGSASELMPTWIAPLAKRST